jgi:ATP-binding cassette, subfamily F, member 3
MLQVDHLHKSYGIHTVLDHISFTIAAGEHVGLVGANGAGKTTLLRILTGAEQPDRGSVSYASGIRLGYLAQALDSQALTVDQALDGALDALRQAEAGLAEASEHLAHSAGAELEAAMAAYDAALARFEALGGYEHEHRAAAILEGLGLGAIERTTPTAALSGGQKTRLGLATLLLGEPDLLLLDEPTNHLDIAALEWLETFVASYHGAALIVSHDRAFLDRTTTRTLVLDVATRTLRSYAGGYSAYAEARAAERERQEQAYLRQREYVERVASDIRRLKGSAASVEGASTPKDSDAKFFLDGKKAAKQLARQAKARERKLERYLAEEERVEKPRDGWGLKLAFGEPPAGGRAVLRLEELGFAYPGQPPLLEQVSLDVDYGERVALAGPNGAGKTTLLRLIAGELLPTAGRLRLGSGVQLGVMAQEQETLDPARSVLETVLRARPLEQGAARSFLHQFLFGGESVFRPVGDCSFGERSRLQLALLVLRGCNLLLLDEPLNHLDIDGREHFQAALEAFAGTVIAVSHDRAFLSSWPSRVLEVRDGGLRRL